jgi:hypothetical protein
VRVFYLGSGLGLMASQLSNVNLLSVLPEQGSEVGVLQGTAQTQAPRSERR